jgi:CheY-like chemotaxis protein
MGYRVTAVSDPAAALAPEVGSVEFDLLFTDQSMPGMNGVALARASRLSGRISRSLTTGFVDDATRAGLTDAGIDTVLAKPYQPRISVRRSGRAALDDPEPAPDRSP